jgi:hypothetical protein
MEGRYSIFPSRPKFAAVGNKSASMSVLHENQRKGSLWSRSDSVRTLRNHGCPTQATGTVFSSAEACALRAAMALIFLRARGDR